jgi:hypothetical protein
MTTRALKLKCYFCGGSLKTNDAFFEIYDQEIKPFNGKPGVRFNEHGGKELSGPLAYPGNGQGLVQDGRWRDYERVVLFTHTRCGPDCGYAFAFDRLGEHWEEHLQTKVWWPGVISEALETARNAMKVAKKKK